MSSSVEAGESAATSRSTESDADGLLAVLLLLLLLPVWSSLIADAITEERSQQREWTVWLR